MVTEHAASSPTPAQTAGQEKKGPYVQKTPEVAPQSSSRARPVEACAAMGASARQAPAMRSGAAQCHLRSPVRFECHALESMATLALVYGPAVSSATCGAEAWGIICDTSSGIQKRIP